MRKIIFFLSLLLATVVLLFCLDMSKRKLEKKKENDYKQQSIADVEINDETEQEEKEEVIICKSEYLLDGKDFTISLSSEDEKLKLDVFAHTDSYKKGSMLLIILINHFENLDSYLDEYSIVIFSNESLVLYLNANGQILIMGTNKDGSASLSAPDWISEGSDVTKEELTEYTNKITEIFKKFAEELDGKL